MSLPLQINEITNTAASLTSADVFPIVQGGITKQTPAGLVFSSPLFTQTGTGAVVRSPNSKWGDIVSVKDFGAKGDGVTDDTTAVQAWVTASAGKRGYAPAGTYLIGSTITLPSNTSLFGDGSNQTIFKAKTNLNSQVFINSDTSVGNTNITLRDFRIEGNSANQGGGTDRSGIVMNKCDYVLIENVRVNDVIDWGFGMYQGNYIILKKCIATAVVGINNSGGARAGFLFGVSSPSVTTANNVVIEGCVASDVTQPYVDGFVFLEGSDIICSDCIAKNVPYSGFKVDAAAQVTLQGNIADNCLIGFQKLSNGANVSFINNKAYKNSSAGFLLNNDDTANIAKGLTIVGNQAVDNGQNAYSALYGASGTRYGFAFEGTASATIDRILVSGNIAIDNGGGTQQRGISFGTNGTFSNVLLQSNLCKGNTADFNNGASLQASTLTYGLHVGFDSASVFLAGGQSRQSLHFWVDNVAAGAGTTLLSDGLSGRGYIMPRAGYLLGIYVKSNAAVTAGSITFFPRLNGSNFGSGLAITSGTFNTTEETFQLRTFAAGDILTCVYSSTAGLLPAGTDDFDVTVVVVY